MVDDIAVQEFVDAISTPPQNTITTYSGVVSRIDNQGVVWVRLAGSNMETPTAVSSSEVNVGDTVTVEWRNNKLYIAGNISNPSAGMARVANVEQDASNANSNALEAMNNASDAVERANLSYGIAANTNQYFWVAETGIDTGAHITEVPKDEWNDSEGSRYHSGGNLLARSNGIAVRDGLTELATFDSDGAEIYSGGDKIAEFGYRTDPYLQDPISTMILGDESKPHVVIESFRDAGDLDESIIKVVGAGETDTYFQIGCKTNVTNNDPSDYSATVQINKNNDVGGIVLTYEDDTDMDIAVNAHEANVYMPYGTRHYGAVRLSDNSDTAGQGYLRVDYEAHFAENIYMDNAKIILGYDANGVERSVIQAYNGSNNVVFGYGGYEGSLGNTNIYGNHINFTARGNINANQPLQVGGYKIITTQTFNADNISVTANGYKEGTISIAKTGYTPVGVLDMYINNATTSGSGSSFVTFYRSYISGTTYHYGIRSVTSSATKVRVYAKILYVATTQGV